MTEPQLSEVLRTQFNVDEGRLNEIIGRPDFAEKLFEGLIERKRARDVVMVLFQYSIPHDRELCSPARAIVRYVKTWPEKSDDLFMACAHFYDTEVAEVLARRL